MFGKKEEVQNGPEVTKQLVFAGYTQDQVAYGAKANGY